MKLAKHFIFNFLLTTLFLQTYSSKNEKENTDISNKIKNLEMIKTISQYESKSNTETNEKSNQVIVNTVRTHQYEEADVAPPGSVLNRIIHNPAPRLLSPVATTINRPLAVTSNEWSIPFPVVKPVQIVPQGAISRPGAVINTPVLGSPPGSVAFQRPVALNIGGVSPTPVPILNSLPVARPMGISTPMIQFPRTSGSFNTNFGGVMESIDDLKISNAFDYIIQGDLDHGVNLLVDFLSHSLPSEHEQILFKISQRIRLSGLNINQDMLFNNLSQKLADKDIMIQKIKKIIEGNKSDSNSSAHLEKNLSNNIPVKRPSSTGHLMVSINKHQALNKKDIINKKANLSNLIQWAKYNKINLRKIHLNFFGNGYDMVKSEDKIKSEETILSVPKEFILTSNNPIIKSLCDNIRKIPELKDEADLICISVSLKTVLKSNPKFKEFVNYLFETVKISNFPLFYNQAENQMIKGSYFLSLIHARRSVYKLQYSILKKKNIFKSKDFSEEDYIRSRVIVNSKLFNLNLSGKKISGLVPIADIFYSKISDSNCELVHLKNGAIQLKTTENINKKENIHLSLGKYSNYHLLMNYGFSIVNNPLSLEVYLDLKIKNESGEKKNKEIILSKDFDINKAMIKLRKIVTKLTNDKSGKNKNFDTPRNIENEYESLRVFKGGLKSQIANYASNIKEDIMRSSKTKNYNEINILNVLIEEKKNVIKYYNGVLIFHKMLKKAKESPKQKLVLTGKLTNMILKKSYLQQYFKILQDNLKLNVEMKNGEEGLNLEDEELMHDLNDSEEESLFSNDQKDSNSTDNDDDYEIQTNEAVNDNDRRESLVSEDEDDMVAGEENYERFLN